MGWNHHLLEDKQTVIKCSKPWEASPPKAPRKFATGKTRSACYASLENYDKALEVASHENSLKLTATVSPLKIGRAIPKFGNEETIVFQPHPFSGASCLLVSGRGKWGSWTQDCVFWDIHKFYWTLISVAALLFVFVWVAWKGWRWNLHWIPISDESCSRLCQVMQNQSGQQILHTRLSRHG